jgi:hypothetical protein
VNVLWKTHTKTYVTAPVWLCDQDSERLSRRSVMAGTAFDDIWSGEVSPNPALGAVLYGSLRR